MKPFTLIVLLASTLAACSPSTEGVKAGSSSSTAQPDSGNDLTQSNLPQWTLDDLRAGGYLERYRLYLDINPFFQAGLFDGDTLVDLAVLVVDSSGRRGLAVVHRADHSIRVLGAGTSFGKGGDDFSWLERWSVVDAAVDPPSGTIGRQMIFVGKGDSAGGMIWWNGVEYVWTQWGD